MDLERKPEMMAKDKVEVRDRSPRSVTATMNSMASPAPAEITAAQRAGVTPAAMAILPMGKFNPRAAPVPRRRKSGRFIAVGSSFRRTPESGRH